MSIKTIYGDFDIFGEHAEDLFNFYARKHGACYDDFEYITRNMLARRLDDISHSKNYNNNQDIGLSLVNKVKRKAKPRLNNRPRQEIGGVENAAFSTLLNLIRSIANDCFAMV